MLVCPLAAVKHTGLGVCDPVSVQAVSLSE